MPDPARRHGRGLRLLGHPVHAALSAFPIALLSVACLADGVGFLSGDVFWWRASFLAMAVGAFATIPTAGAGLIDFAAIDSDEAAARTGTSHMLLMLTAVCRAKARIGRNRPCHDRAGAVDSAPCAEHNRR